MCVRQKISANFRKIKHSKTHVYILHRQSHQIHLQWLCFVSIINIYIWIYRNSHLSYIQKSTRTFEIQFDFSIDSFTHLINGSFELKVKIGKIHIALMWALKREVQCLPWKVCWLALEQDSEFGSQAVKNLIKTSLHCEVLFGSPSTTSFLIPCKVLPIPPSTLYRFNFSSKSKDFELRCIHIFHWKDNLIFIFISKISPHSHQLSIFHNSQSQQCYQWNLQQSS